MDSELDRTYDDTNLLSDKTADRIACLMASTELGKRCTEQFMRDVCRAFACNLRRLKEGKWTLS